MAERRGFIVAGWESSGRLFFTGRLEDGRSFALVLPAGGGALFAAAREAEAFAAALEPLGAKPARESWSTMSGEELVRFDLKPGSRNAAERALSRAGLRPRAVERGGAEDFRIARGLSGGVLIRGEERPGRRVDAVFVDAQIEADPYAPRLRWLALDIETDRDEGVLAVSLVAADELSGPASAMGETDATGSAGTPDSAGSEGAPSGFRGEVLFLGPELGVSGITSFPNEASLLEALALRLPAYDPDVVTGWNIVDFDLRVLASRAAARGLRLALGRTQDAMRMVERKGGRVVADIPGRAVLDGMRLMRASGERYEDQSLETVSRAVLGEGKSVSASGEDKLAELDRLRREDPVAFCSYCRRDSELVLGILAKTGLARLTARRAALVGLPLDLAWTSIPAFERVYAAGLMERRVVPPEREERAVSGAAGGTVLDPEAGFFEGVLVFDFRSLYPSLMRTFNIDPLSRARAEARGPGPDDIEAPNGARFDREPGVLPAVITRYASEREASLASGDEVAAYVYKILQNSFYGVLGAQGCRYAKTELAGAITSFGRKYLLFARDFFESRGYRALYGDTDSVFVLSGLGAGAATEEYATLGDSLCVALNAEISASIRAEYGLESFLKIRRERLYLRFFIPRLRLEPEGMAAGRGRAKGYAGLVRDGSGGVSVEVKGMEAARSDWTPLARRFQVELLGIVFGAASGGRASGTEAQAREHCKRIAAELRSGALDRELVYRKSLRRPASDYASETPQVHAARLMGWEGRRGAIHYVMTKAGAEPPSKRSGAAMDYGHYVERQILPIARAIAESMARASGGGWDAHTWFADRPQMEFEF